MKSFIKSFTLVLILLTSSIAQENKTNLPDHPRIMWQADQEAVIKQKLSQNKTLNGLHNIIMEQADNLIATDEVERIKTGRRLLAVSRKCLKRVITLSYAYRMTQDEKYLKKAEAEMLAASAFSDWNPSHFLDVAEMTMALAIGYDWLYNNLSEQSRNTIKKAILNKGLLPSLSGNEEYVWWLDISHNWNQVCNAGMVYGALAIYEDEPETANRIIDRAKQTIGLAQEEYEPDGAYPEGPTYWSYGTTFNLMLIDAYYSLWPDKNDLVIGDGFLKTGEYVLHAHGPVGSYNYSDGGIYHNFLPAMFWFSARTHDPEILWNQKLPIEKIFNDEGSQVLRQSLRFLPLAVLWASRVETFQFTLPTSTSWVGHGSNPVGFHRTSWDDDALFIGIKGGAPVNNHGHMDVGSFIMDAQGVRWVKDLGAHGYHKLEAQGIDLWNKAQDSQRWQIFRYNNSSHSTLVVNGKDQKVEAKGDIVKHSGENMDFKYTIVDMTPVYEGQLARATRGIALVDSKYVMVRDEIANVDSSGQVRWAITTFDSVEITDNRTAVIRRDGKSMTVRIVQPENAKIETFSTDPQNDFEDKNPGTIMVGFKTDLAPNEKTNLIVQLCPQGAGLKDQVSLKKLAEW